MGLTIGRAVRTLERPYTRKSKVKSKGYIKAIPPKHIVKFIMGDSNKFYINGFSYMIRLVSKDGFQIRDNAIEAARTHVLRELELIAGKDFFFAVSIAPHHIIREHKQAAVAQADRISTGMQKAFGKPTSLAAQVKPGKTIFKIAFNNMAIVPKIRAVLDKIKPKLSCRTVTLFEKLKEEKRPVEVEAEILE
jgi:large subunit ribosomal protein L10e